MKKGKTLTFDELYDWLEANHTKKWRLFANGGLFGFLHHLNFSEVWTTEYFDVTDGGHKTFRFAAFDDENHFLQEIAFGGYEDLDYRIEVYNDKPLELLIEFRDRYEMDSQFAIFQEL
jgi:hypothetical protein